MVTDGFTTGDFVVALIFTEDGRRLVLIRKDDRIPLLAWKLNGVGGKVDRGESVLEALTREILEETGIYIPPEQWEHVLTMMSPDGSRKVGFFRVFSDLALTARTMETEEVQHYALDQFRLSGDRDLFADMQWIIPLALDRDVVLPIGPIVCQRVLPKT